MGGRGHSPQIASLNQQEQPQQTTPSRWSDRQTLSRGRKIGKRWKSIGKIRKPKIRLCKVELSILYGVRWARAGYGQHVCLILAHTLSLSFSFPPSQPPPLLLADYVMGRHLMIVLRRHEIDVFANFAIELQSKRWREMEHPSQPAVGVALSLFLSLTLPSTLTELFTWGESPCQKIMKVKAKLN